MAETSRRTGGPIRDLKDLENAQLRRQARGSLYQVRDHLTTCVDEGYLEVTERERLDKLAQTVARLLNGYLRSTLARKRDER